MNLHGSRATLLSSQGRHAEAVADWDQVLALNDVPANEASYRLSRLLSLLKAGDHARAVVEIERIARPEQGGSPPTGTDLYNLACFYALASSAAAPMGPDGGATGGTGAIACREGARFFGAMC